MIIGFDTETELIRPGLAAPPMACLTWSKRNAAGELEHNIHHVNEDARDAFVWILDNAELIGGAHIAYDMAVAMNQWPDLTPKIFQAYADDRITDIELQQRLYDNAKGLMWLWENREGYNLNGLVKRYYKERDRAEQKHGPDIWRLRYAELIPVPLRDWPEAAVAYALDDADDSFLVLEKQLAEILPWLKNAPDQARAALSLYLDTCWGVHTNPESVERLRLAATRLYDEVGVVLSQYGLIWGDKPPRVKGQKAPKWGKPGSRNTKAAKQRMFEVLRANKLPFRLTDKGEALYKERTEELEGQKPPPEQVLSEAELIEYLSLDEDACKESCDDVMLAYAFRTSLHGVVNTHVPDLLKGVELPIQARFNPFVETGRTSCSKGKPKKKTDRPPPLNGFQLQNPKRDMDFMDMRKVIDRLFGIDPEEVRDLEYLKNASIRGCFEARPGYYFFDNDFSGLELHTVAQACLKIVGYSRMADALNAGQDPHLLFAARMLGISYEEAVHRKHEKAVKKARQLAKIANFGFPGGLGAAGFRAFAFGYGEKIDEEMAQTLRRYFFETWPEFHDYFKWVRQQLDPLTGLATIEQLFVGRLRGGCRYTVACNTLFQGLGADGAKRAHWEVTRRCYDPTMNSVLYGARPWNFVHDEIVAETPIEISHEQAFEAARVMVDACNVYLPNVPVRCAPAISKTWMKEAEGIVDANGRLQPYDLAKAGKWKVYYLDGQPVNWAA